MTSIYFKEATHSFGPPKGQTAEQCHNLVLMHNKARNTFSSLWRPSASDLAVLNTGGCLQLNVYGGQPPVSIQVPGAEDEIFFNEIPPKEFFENCKQINHRIDGAFAADFDTYEDWCDAILDTKSKLLK